MTKIRIFAVVAMGVFTLLTTGLLSAQTESGIAAEIVEGLDLGASGAKRFDANDLHTGDLFPAMEIFDESGNPFHTATLRGKYTVLVNGCLT